MAYNLKYVFGPVAGNTLIDIVQDGVKIASEAFAKVAVDPIAKTATYVYNGQTLDVEGYPFPAVTSPPPTVNGDPPALVPQNNDKPLSDSRLIWNFGFGVDTETTVAALYSWNTTNQIEVVEGMNYQDGEDVRLMTSKKDTGDRRDLYGVPSIMNPHAYLVLSPAGDNEKSNRLLVDTIDPANTNGKLWYESGLNVNEYRANSPTTSNLINWSREAQNEKRSYKFSDFAFCKYWKKIPNNYLITLRRFTFPVNDSLAFVDEDTMKPEYKLPASTMITWLGAETGNTITKLLSFEAGMNWGEVKSDLWTTQAPDGKDEVGSEGVPGAGSGVAKLLGLFTEGTNTDTNSKPAPLDPYDGGPYANKVIGPIDVIQRVAKRDRGLTFKQTFSLEFHYSARSFGGANTKAIMLDILGNMLIMTNNSALFWGGQNRVLPGGSGAKAQYPFLGGKEGFKAFQAGDPGAFFGAIGKQFSAAFSNLGDIFGKLLSGDFAGVLSGVAGQAMKQKHINQGNAPQVQGLKSLLTGDPVGEWHVTIGNPLNPMIVVGNLICKGIKVEFGEELGPDDFPLDVKATIELEHGMDRDRDRIMSMFNYGNGRLYGLPKEYRESFSSSTTTSVDPTVKSEANGSNAAVQKAGTSTPPAPTGSGRSGAKSKKNKNPLYGDPQDVDRVIKSLKDTGSSVKATFAGIWTMGEGGRVPPKPQAPPKP
jgi:hypothetical protein